MNQINLRDLYPDVYTEDTFVEVTEEVLAVFLADRKAQAAYKRQLYRHQALLTLDDTRAIKGAVLQNPEEIIEDRQLREHLYNALMALPEKQAKRIYARFYLDMTVKEIAQAEGVEPSMVYRSIRCGLSHLKKFF